MRKFHKIIAEIKTLSKQQTELKPQRKTIYLNVERTISSEEASYTVFKNSYKLMHLFITYAKLKGLEPEMPKKQSWDSQLIDNFVKLYTPEIEEIKEI